MLLKVILTNIKPQACDFERILIFSTVNLEISDAREFTFCPLILSLAYIFYVQGHLLKAHVHLLLFELV